MNTSLQFFQKGRAITLTCATFLPLDLANLNIILIECLVERIGRQRFLASFGSVPQKHDRRLKQSSYLGSLGHVQKHLLFVVFIIYSGGVSSETWDWYCWVQNIYYITSVQGHQRLAASSWFSATKTQQEVK